MKNLTDRFESAEQMTKFRLVKDSTKWVRVYESSQLHMGGLINHELNKEKSNPLGDYPNVQFSIERGDWQKEGCSAFLRFVDHGDRPFKIMGSKWPRNILNAKFLLNMLEVPIPEVGTIYLFKGDNLVWDAGNRIMELKFNASIKAKPKKS